MPPKREMEVIIGKFRVLRALSKLPRREGATARQYNTAVHSDKSYFPRLRIIITMTLSLMRSAVGAFRRIAIRTAGSRVYTNGTCQFEE